MNLKKTSKDQNARLLSLYSNTSLWSPIKCFMDDFLDVFKLVQLANKEIFYFHDSEAIITKILSFFAHF